MGSAPSQAWYKGEAGAGAAGSRARLVPLPRIRVFFFVRPSYTRSLHTSNVCLSGPVPALAPQQHSKHQADPLWTLTMEK